MYPHTHFIVAFFVGMIFTKAGHITIEMALIAALISVLIDLDHLIEYGIRHKEWSMIKAWNASVVYHELERSFIHYHIGFIIVSGIIIFVGLFSIPLAIIKATAYYSHFFLDHMHVYINKRFKFRELGLHFNISLQELMIDLFFILGLILLV